MKVQIEKDTIKDRYVYVLCGLINMYKKRLTDGNFLNLLRYIVKYVHKCIFIDRQSNIYIANIIYICIIYIQGGKFIDKYKYYLEECGLNKDSYLQVKILYCKKKQYKHKKQC